jgi:hypothetical protein
MPIALSRLPGDIEPVLVKDFTLERTEVALTLAAEGSGKWSSEVKALKVANNRG